MKRPLFQTVVDFAEAILPRADTANLRVSRVSVDTPLELAILREDGELQVLAGPPRWRWTTAFDSRPGRLRLDFAPEESP